MDNLTPGELIEQMERETGQRWDANNGQNATMWGLFGMLARALGKSDHDSRDDVAAGALIMHELSPEGQREREAKETLGAALAAGISPDVIAALSGRK